MNIVCYTGGTCGDIIARLIDDQELSSDRQRLKKPHLFSSSEEKDQYIASSTWRSLPSHDFEYHQLKQHNILGIQCRDMPTALWAANRFKALHRLQVWEEMCRSCGLETIDQCAQMMIDFGNMIADYTSDVLLLDRIVAGYAIDDLNKLNIPLSGERLYSKWLIDETMRNTN